MLNMAQARERIVVEDKLFVTLIQVSRFVGFAPVRLMKTGTRTIVYISRLFLMYGVICNLIFSIQLYESIQSSKYNSEKFLLLYRITSTCSTTLLVNRAAFCGVSRMKNFMYCLNQIQKIKKKVGTKYESTSLKRQYYLFSFIFSSMLFLVISLDFWLFNKSIRISEYFTYFVYFLKILLELQFIAVAISINYAFEAINKCLQDMLIEIHLQSEFHQTGTYDLQLPVKSSHGAIELTGVSNDNQLHSDIKVMQTVKIAKNIRQINHSFALTSDVLRVVNKSENVTFFIMLAISTLDLTFTAYNLLEISHIKEISNKDIVTRTLLTIWFAYHTIKVVMFTEPCNQTQEKVSRTRYLVCRIMSYVTSDADPLHDEIGDFFKYLTLNNPSYSALGICNIGRSLISTIIGCVTTIIIFLYQF